jgi:penicillin-binding protein 2
MTATPLQLANVMCIIANKGYYYTPHFVDSIQEETVNDTLYLARYRRKHEVTHIADSTYRIVQLGMQDVVTRGTAQNAMIPGINVCGKTGTAQNPHGKNHSLFVCFAPRENPKIAVAVIVENSGFGATWAAPIGSLLMEKFLNDTISEKRKPEVERITKADLIPAAIKHWYYVRDSLRQLKLAREIDETVTVVISQPNRKITFDPEAEPNRKEPNDTSVTRKSHLLEPGKKREKRDGIKHEKL